MGIDDKAKIGATIGLIWFLMLFIEPMIFNTFFALLALLIMITALLIVLLWMCMYFGLKEFFEE